MIFALYTLLALLGVALLVLSRQTLTCLCTQLQAEEEETEAIQRIRDALLVENGMDGLPRLVVLDGQHGGCVLTPDDPDYSEVADHIVRICPQVAALLRRADAEPAASHEDDSDSDDDSGQSPHLQTARS